MDGEEGSEKRSLSDAARDVIRGFRDTRPDFLSNKGKKNSKRRNGSDGVVGGLRFAEQSAVNDGIGASASGLGGVRDKETKVGGLYSGNGKTAGGVGEKSGKGKKKSRGWLKKGGPVGLIIGLIVGVGGIMGGSQLFQPFSLVAQFQETFNSMQVSANTRSSRFFRLQMESGRVKDPVRGTIFGKTFSITKKQKERLKQQGIEFDENYEIDGKKTKVLKFDDGSGDIKVITAREFDDVYNSNTDFHRAYNAGSMTWRGQIANWFGTRVSAFLKNNNLTRNMFNDYENKKAQLDGDGLAAVKETLGEKTDMIDNEGEKVRESSEGETDDDGKVTGYKKEDSSNDSGKIKRGDTSSLSSKMKNIESKFSASANIVCGVSNAIGTITLAVTAAEALQIINLATAYFETADKVKAGYGDDAPIHELATTLNEKQNTTDKVLKSASVDGDGSSESDYKGTYEDKTYEGKSAMEAEGVAALYSGGKVNTNDASVQSFNLTASVKNVLGGIGASMTAFQGCTIAKLALSAYEAVDGLVDTLECVGGIISSVAGGAGIALAVKGCVELAVDIGGAILKSAAIGVAIAGVFSILSPILISAWTRDLVSNLGGVDLGNALTSGGNMYLGGAHRANGGSPATREKYESYAVAQRQVMEDYARYERESLDPFDTTSKYTFMGTLLTQLMSFTSANSLMSTITSGGSVVNNSIAALSPTASAYDIASTLPTEEEYENTCPYLASIGVIGDAYCNPYVMTDMSTINNDPVDVINKVNDFGGLADETTSDGNVKIKGDSDLAKYIVYCDGRTSMFGITDYNIVSSLNSSTSANTGNTYTDAVIDGGIGALPFIGDGIDVIENINSLNNLGYISGESCVAGNTVDNASAPSWDEAKYYQRFIEDQSLAESMGVVEKSAVTAYLEEYYKENPLDNSYEGMLARYSGLDKETVSDILYIARYYEYVNNYNPVERYAFGEPAVKVEKELKFDNENTVADNLLVILFNPISYADVRNRSFAA